MSEKSDPSAVTESDACLQGKVRRTDKLTDRLTNALLWHKKKLHVRAVCLFPL